MPATGRPPPMAGSDERIRVWRAGPARVKAEASNALTASNFSSVNRGSCAGHGQRHDPRNYTKKTDSTQRALTFAKIHRVSLFLLPLPELLRILCVKSVYERHLTASYFSTMSFFWV